nr:MAG TPA: hypothetical protein [Caudoviricetes sp.]
MVICVWKCYISVVCVTLHTHFQNCLLLYGFNHLLLDEYILFSVLFQ